MSLRTCFRTLAALLISGVLCAQAVAQSAPSVSPPGQFDFYVLSLSWSPSYCEGTGDQRRDPQCARPFGFVVHGLWPQFERGFPSDCGHGPRLPQALINAQLDVFPAPGLVIHEWTKHGACSGLEPAAYFAAVHRAFAGITVPPELTHIDKPQFTAPTEIAKAFTSANKGLEPTSFAVICDRKQRLQEVRVCLNKDLKSFHPCPQVVSSQCRSDKTYMPAMRAAN